jgi:hypothetical protein
MKQLVGRCVWCSCCSDVQVTLLARRPTSSSPTRAEWRQLVTRQVRRARQSWSRRARRPRRRRSRRPTRVLLVRADQAPRLARLLSSPARAVVLVAQRRQARVAESMRVGPPEAALAGTAGTVAAGSGGSGAGGNAGGPAGNGGTAATAGALPLHACKCRLTTNGRFITSRDWCDPPPAGTRTVNELDASDIAKCAARQAVNRAMCCGAPRKDRRAGDLQDSKRARLHLRGLQHRRRRSPTPAPGNIVITWTKTTASGSTTYPDCLQPQGSVCERRATFDVHLMTASSHVAGVCL